MKNPAPTPLPRLACASLLTLAGCGSTTPTPPPQQPTQSQVAAPRPEPVDLSQVPAPASLLVTVRVASPRGLARRLGERVGVAEVATMLEEALPGALGDDEAMARAVDLDAPLDVVVYANERGRPRAVLAFGAVSLPRAEDALSQGHRLTPVGNGARRVERTGRGPNECPDLAEGSTEECVVASQTHCVLAPAAGAERAARFVCADRYNDIEPALAYLTRTLPRAAAPDGDVTVDLSADGLRRELDDDAREAAEHLERDLVPQANATNAPFLDRLRTYVREQLAPTLTRGLDDLQGARLTARVADEGLAFHGELALRSTNAPLAQRLVAATRDAHPSAELLGRLTPTMTSYGAGAGSFLALRPEWELLGAVAPTLLLEGTTLPAADQTAVRSAVDAFFRATPHDRFQVAVGAGPAAGGGSWTVGVYQLDAPAAVYVTQLRTVVATLRRPAVARAINASLHVNPATLLTPPPAGLPAGSYIVRIPVPASVPANARASLGLGTATALEIAAVPEGNTLWVAYGVDARARLIEARRPHPAAFELRGLAEPGVLYGGAILPTGLANLASRYDPQVGRNLERAIQRTPGANAPLTFFARARQEGAGATFTGDFTVPTGVLGLVGASLRQSP
ncbi:MAG: hypothetical protein U0324_09405 [Polyangiales bacterium]